MRWLRAVAFVSGLVVLGVEVTAFRIVSPYFGSSIFTTTNLLGVILAALALGYWLGGRVADRQADTQTSWRHLHQTLIVAAIIVAALPTLAPLLLGAMRGWVSGLDWSLILVSLSGGAVLFFIPFAILGMVSPWLIRLSTRSVQHSGQTAGSFFAWSTLGSLLGTFLPTLVLVPTLSTKRTILLLAVLLALVGGLGLARRRWLAPTFLLLALIPATQPRYFALSSNVVVEREGATEYLRIVEQNGRLHLQQDEGYGVHSVYDPNSFTTGMVFDWFAAAPALRQAPPEIAGRLRLGVVGLAGGTVTRQYAEWFGSGSPEPYDLSLSGVELDPETLALARQFFALDQITPEVATATGDGRVWLAGQEPFDVLVVDAFRQLYIPPHLSSREFFSLARERLAPGGVAVVNLNVVGEDTLVEKKLSATLADVFKSVSAVRVPNSYNILYFAADHTLEPKAVPSRLKPEALTTVAQGLANFAQLVEPTKDPWLIATDDRPLVESLYDAMVARAALTNTWPGQ